MSILDKETRQLVNRSRRLGNGALTIFLEDYELIRLCIIALSDLERMDLAPEVSDAEVIGCGYYSTPLDWFRQPTLGVAFEELFAELCSSIVDFNAYFEQLCSLHKRRVKFEMILKCQPLPTMEQVVPRCLLEFGLRPSDTLASWLVWRKWLYDIDNRSAQETGYLFEPILAAAIGGVPCGHKNSPIKRVDEPSKGRQVDCLDDRLAYEFKMRVTIAASGQGRFREELAFARDCKASGYTPVLLVLDPTPSSRLADLINEYAEYGGHAFVGDEAWQHIIDKAGGVMGAFVSRYVEAPLREVESAYTELMPLSLARDNDSIALQIGDSVISIHRLEGCIDLETPEDEEV